VLHLRDRGGSGLELDHFAIRMVLRRHPVLRIQNASAVVFVVADDDRARLARVLADDDGRAADRIEGERAQRDADGCGDCLELHGHSNSLHLVVFLFSALLDAFKAPPGCGEEIKTFTLDFYSEKSQLQFMLTA